MSVFILGSYVKALVMTSDHIPLAGGYGRWRQCAEYTNAHITYEGRCAFMMNNASDIYLSHSILK